VATLQAPDGVLPLVGLTQALGQLPHLQVDAPLALAVRQGKAIAWSQLAAAAGEGAAPVATIEGRFQILGPGGGLLAVAERGSDGTVRSLRVFNDVQTSAESPKRASV